MMKNFWNLFAKTNKARCLYCFQEITEGELPANTVVQAASPTPVAPTSAAPVRNSPALVKCPKCNYRLPPRFFDGTSKIIAITGGTDSGKTIFMTVLTKILREATPLTKKGKGLAVSIPSKSENLQQRNRENLLYNKKETLASTASSDPDLRLVIQLLVDTGKQTNESLFLSFRDMPGSDMRDVDNIASNDQILNADGLIYVLDPFTISAIYNSLIKRPGYEDVEPSDIDAVEEVTNLYNALSSKQGLRNQKINLPVAFCVSKIDLLHSMARIKLPDALTKDNADEAMDMIEEVCDDFYEKLKQLSENHQATSLITAIEARFSNFLFFPMSALGLVNQNMSIPSSFLDASPEPVGVVHPLYWVLKKVGFL